jgi:hypothetical protein
VSRNEHTGKEMKTGPATPEYRENHERIFGSEKIQRGRWIQDPVTGQLISANEYQRKDSDVNLMVVVKGFDAYESPTTGEVVSNYRQRDIDLKKSGCRQYEGKQTEMQEAAKIQREQKERLVGRMSNTMEKTYYEIEHGYRRVKE